MGKQKATSNGESTTRMQFTSYEVTIQGLSPYSQSRHHEIERLEGEPGPVYEERTWRNRMHVDSKGEVFIPGMQLKNSLVDAAKYLGISVGGKGSNKYTKHFEAGCMVPGQASLGIKADQVPPEAVFVPSDGVRGGGKRVTKLFPYIETYVATFTIEILDRTITEKVLRTHLDVAGQLIGIGRFRPRNNGFYGRFLVLSLRVVNVREVVIGANQEVVPAP